MLEIKFEGNCELGDFSIDKVSENVECIIAKTNKENGYKEAIIKILAKEYKDFDDYDNPENEYKEIGELFMYLYSANQLDLDLMAHNLDELDRNENLFIFMDAESGDTSSYYEILREMYPKIRIDEMEAANLYDDVHLIALQRFFINEEYRGKKIGTYIMKNFAKILSSTININPIYVVGILEPDDKTKETKDIQKKTMKKAGIKIAKFDGMDVFAGRVLDPDIF